MAAIRCKTTLRRSPIAKATAEPNDLQFLMWSALLDRARSIEGLASCALEDWIRHANRSRHCPANRRCDRSSVNKTKPALFARTDNDCVVIDTHAGRFATITPLQPTTAPIQVGATALCSPKQLPKHRRRLRHMHIRLRFQSNHEVHARFDRNNAKVHFTDGVTKALRSARHATPERR